MNNSKTKYYLRPTGFLGNNHGRQLEKKGEAVSIQKTFFSHVEVISKNQAIKKKILNIPDLFKLLDEKKVLCDIFNQLKKKNSSIEKNIFNNNKFSIFGILNITPDSFSDGGKNLNTDKAIKYSQYMKKNGASFIDIGGESTRPGADKVDAGTELSRVMPVIQKLNYRKFKISLDTRNSSTMKFGILSGVKVINDVSALSNDKKSIEVIKKYNSPVIIMHMPGTPKTMMKKNKYKNVLLDVYDFLDQRTTKLIKSGIKRENIIIDPGIGFGKNLEQNMILIKNISIFHSLGFPIMLGLSRKRFIDSISKESNPENRLGGTISASLLAIMQGVRIHRVHDVKDLNQSIKVFDKLVNL